MMFVVMLVLRQPTQVVVGQWVLFLIPVFNLFLFAFKYLH